MLGRKILITGNIGSGKTTLCRALSESLGLPAFHYDQIVWQPGWKKSLPDDRSALTQQLAEKNEWVIDAVSKQLTQAADTIIFLDFPRSVCAWRTLKRNIQCRFRTRPEMPADCPDYKQIPFIIRIIWKFPTTQRPWILGMMDEMRLRKTVVHIQHQRQLQDFLATL